MQRASLTAPLQQIPDIPRMFLNRNKVYTFSRSFTETQIASSTTLDVVGAYSFSLSNLPGNTDFSTLFDEYRLIQFTVQFIPSAETAVGQPLYTIIDPDDANIPGSLGVVLQYDTLAVTPPGHYLERTFQGKTSSAAYTGTFSGFTNNDPNVWIDSASNNVLYYGLKYYIPAAASNASTWYPLVTVVVQCRKPD